MKDDFINDVILSMSTELGNEELRKLKGVLARKLQDKEITSCCTDLEVVDEPMWRRHIDMWIACKRLKNCSDLTIDGYRLAVTKLFETVRKEVEDITANDIRAYLDWYQSTREKKISASYFNTLRRYYSSFFTWAQNEGIRTSNPIASIERAQMPYVVRKPFSPVELEKIKRACETPRDTALIETLFATGGRVSEIAQINISDINFIEKSLILYGKRKKQREVYLTDVACHYIKEYLKTRTDDNEALFVSLKKPYDRIHKCGIESRIHKIGDMAGVENVHPHRFRRTLATTAISRGMPVYELRDLMGHDKLETTMVYCKIAQGDIKHSYKKLIS